MVSRRDALQHLGVGAVLASTNTKAWAQGDSPDFPRVGTNTYPWATFAKRSKKKLTLHTDALLGDIASTGIVGYEPIIQDPKEFVDLKDRLQKHKLRMPSLYVNSVLHDKKQALKSIDDILQIAEKAKEVGVKIIVTNPSPIQWGGRENKNDRQLEYQASMLNRLGGRLGKLGMVLAYHHHDAELRAGGREFHHMLTATDPRKVKFCLDAHWIFRGCDDSRLAVFDFVQHYHDRIVELHLRQSINGIWQEVFTVKGDIDYTRLFQFLAQQKINPYMVLEQAVEEKTPTKRPVVEAHRQSYQNLTNSLNALTPPLHGKTSR